jgi:transposase
MPTQRLSMRRIREVLRLRHQGLTERVIAQMIGVSNGAVHGYLQRARLAGLTWPLPEGMDDEGLSVLNASERRDLLEILDDRHGRASIIVTSQIPVEHWHEIIGDPTLGDAILDRLVHNAHRLQLTGESMRKQNTRNRTLDVASNA